MTVTIHPRETGATLRCNRCREVTLTTGQIQVKAIRAYAKTLGWIRGLRKTKWIPPGSEHRLPANRRHDVCPGCAPAERDEAETRKRLTDERRATREAKRLAAKQVAA